jgi:catechol 2,3-dioxygenase-like lactoylglutathione lyase family enzyme
METREVQVTFDCAAPGALAAFWCAALGYELAPPPPGFDTWAAALDAWGVPEAERDTRSAASPPAGQSGPRLFFQRVPEPKTAKNRVHLDVRAAPGLEGEARMAALGAEAERLVALGARVVHRYAPDGRLQNGHLVLQDPEGNELCLD